MSNATTSLNDLVATLPWQQIGARVIAVRHLQDRKDSAISAVEISAGGATRSVIVKQHRAASRDGRSASELARHEFEVLGTMRKAMTLEREPSGAEQSFGVPEPLLLDEARCTLVMEHVAGTPLDQVIRNTRRRGLSPRLAAPLRAAGTWLRVMQEATRSDDDVRQSLDSAVAGVLADLDRAIDRDVTLRPQRTPIADAIAALSDEVNVTSLRVTGVHGDFWPGNVYISPGRVQVIDFEGFRRGLPLQDVVYLVAYLEELPLGRVDGSLLRRYFLDGYSLGAPIDGAAFALLRLGRALQSLAWDPLRANGILRRLIRRSPRERVIEAVRQDERTGGRMH